MNEKPILENVYKIKLVNPRGPGRRPERVVFDVTPQVVEARSVQYEEIAPVHAPGYIMIYKTTGSRSFDLGNVTLVSQTPMDASKNIRILHTLRSWTMPRFGKKEPVTGIDRRGEPPPVLYFSAYSDPTKIGSKYVNHINKVPVVITQLTFDYPSDVAYINTEEGTPMPVVMNLTISLTETHAPIEYEQFSLTKFKQGSLPHF